MVFDCWYQAATVSLFIVVMVTHDLTLAEQCERRIWISDGRISDKA